MTAAPGYFDTSAIVKLYLKEAYSEDTASLFTTAQFVSSHEIAFVETRAALASARRTKRLDESEYAISVRNFCDDWSHGVTPIGTDDTLLERAAELAEGFGLRGYDAMHLASADRLRSQLPALVFVSFDRALNRAAKLIGLSLPDFTPLA
jgi:predicted nucleic acid-binding protein